MIHQYQNNGYNIVLDVNSGAIHVVDELMYEIIGMYEEHTPEEIRAQLADKYSAQEIDEAFDEMNELIKNGELFTPDEYEEYIGEIGKNRETVVKALCLHIAHDCNLACKYCFAEEGEYHGKRELMSYEAGKAALDFLIASSGNRRNLEVDFFGGEPTLNFQVVKDLVAYGRSQEEAHNKKFRFTLTTNGVLLNDDIMEFANREMDNVVLSIDGRPEVNNRMRPFPNGAGSYDLIVPKFQKFADSRHQERYYVRGTFTHHNTDFAADVLHLADLGFKQISVEPVVAPPEADYAIQEADLPQLFEEYDKLAKEMIERHKNGKDFNFFHFMIDLEGPVWRNACRAADRVRNIWQSRRGEISTRAISLLATRSFTLEMCMMESNMTRSCRISRHATFTPRRNAEIVLQDFTAAVVARQIRTTSTAASTMHMTSGVRCRKNV